MDQFLMKGDLNCLYPFFAQYLEVNLLLFKPELQLKNELPQVVDWVVCLVVYESVTILM